MRPYPATQRTLKARAQLGAACGPGKPEPERVPDLRRDLRAAQLEDHIVHVLAQAPPLSDDQRSAIIALLRGETNSAVA